MEENNPNQSVNPSGPFVQTQPVSNSVNNQKGFFPIILGVLVLLLVIGGGAYYLGTQKNANILPNDNTTQNSSINLSPTILPTEEPTNASLKSHDSKYFSVSYPSNWYEWSFGRGVDLDYYQINSISEFQQASNNRSHIAFDIQGIDYTDSKTIEEQRKVVEDLKRKYPEQNYVISEQTVDGQKALVYEMTIDNAPSYQKTVWLVKDNVKYIISWSIHTENVQKRDQLKNQYSQDFDTILSTLKLK